MSPTPRFALRAAVGAFAFAVGIAVIAPAPVSASSLAAPGALSPDTTAQRHNVALRWAAVSGATGYEVQLNDYGDFAHGTTVTAATPYESWVPPVTLPRGQYLWRVRAKAGATTGPWSAEAKLVRGWTDSPSGASTSAVTAGRWLPTLRWAPMPDASFYEVEISNKPFDGSTSGGSAPGGSDDHYLCYTTHPSLAPYGVDKGNGAAVQETTPGNQGSCAFTVTGEAASEDGKLDGKFHSGSTYFWRVRGRDSTVDTRTTPFTDAAFSCQGVWFRSGAAAATSGSVVVPIGASAPDHTPTPECSRWLTGGSFTVPAYAGTTGAVPAPVAASVAPTLNAAADPVALTDTPEFSWTPVSTAVKYRLYISRTDDFRDSDHIYETIATTLRPVGAYFDRALPTYWAVQACGVYLCSPLTPTQRYTKVSRINSVPLTTTASASTAVLNWSGQYSGAVGSGSVVPLSLEAKAFQVQVAKNGDFTAPVLDTTIDRFPPVDSSMTGQLSVDVRSWVDATYAWRVRPLEETGAPLRWSASQSFLVNKNAPTVGLVTASGFGLGTPLTLRFSEPVTNVTAATLGVRVVGSATPLAGTVTSIGSNTYLFAPSARWTAGQRYQAWVSSSVQDAGGKSASVVGGAVRASTLVDSADPSMAKVAGDYGWTTYAASDAVKRSYVASNDRLATTTRSYVRTAVTGSTVYVYGCRSPRSGKAAVYIDGTLRAVVDLYRSYSGCGVVYTSPGLSSATHTVTVVVLGTKNAASSGTAVAVDAVRVL